MSDDAADLASYLRALSDLHPSQVHAMRSQLGNLSLHATLAAESLDRAAGVEPAARERIAQALGKINGDVRGLVESVERWLGQMRLDVEPQTFAMVDLARDLEALVRPFLTERRIEWATDPAAPSLIVTGERATARRRVLGVLVERAKRLPAGARITLGWGVEDGAVTARVDARAPGGDAEPTLLVLPVEPRKR